jgi:hypothetical protein
VSFRVPAWLAAIVLALLAFLGAERFLSGQAARRHFAEVTADKEALELVIAEREAVDLARLDSIAELQAERELLGALLDQEKLVARRAALEVRVTATRLREYLEEDTAGLALVAELEARHAAEVDAYELALANSERRNALLLRENQLFQRRVEDRDSTISALSSQLEIFAGEAETWYRKANPPFHVQLFRTGIECGAGGLAAGLASKNVAVGIVGALGCGGVKFVLKT